MKRIIILFTFIFLINVVSASEWYYPLSNYTGYPGLTFNPSEPSRLSFVPGVVGNSVYGWNGYNARMIFDTNENYTFNQMTVSFWVKSEVTGGYKNLFWMFQTPPYTLTTRTIVQVSSSNIYWWWSDSAPIFNYPLYPNTWTHVAYVLDGQTARFYINGTQVDYAPCNNTLVMDELRIGAMGWIDGTSNEVFNMQGNMDELYIFLNESKDANWVKAQYEEVYPPPKPEVQEVEDTKDNNIFFVNQNLNLIKQAQPICEDTDLWCRLHQFILNIRKALGLPE